MRFQLEVRRSWLALMAAYFGTGVLTAVVGGHLALAGRDGMLAGATAFTTLAVGAALFHELGHALAGLAFGRRPLGLVLKAGAAIRIEGAEPGARGDSAPAESLVALGGPLASTLIGLAYFGMSTSFTTPFAWAGLLAVFDGLANLVPVMANSDGGRILHAFTDARSGSPSTTGGG